MKIFAVLTVALALAGCTTTGKQLASVSIETMCGNYLGPSMAFDALAATGKIKQSTIDKKRNAVVALEAVCANPPTDTKTAIATASRVFSALLLATAEARKAAGT